MRKLSESIWSDIQDRSSGETIRKEDDINLLDRDSLYDYLTSHYKNTNSFDPICNSDTYNTIKVPFLIQGGSDGVYLDFKENEVYIPYASPYKVKGLFSKLADEFSLKSDSKTGHTWYIISPKDGSKVTNTFYIYVIDFLIDNIPDTFERGVKKIVNESIWSDIQDRSAGETVRKEDDINHLDSEGLYEYLKNIYKELDSFQSIRLHPTMNTISVPIFVKGFKPYMVFFEFDNEEIFIEHAMAYAITGFFSKLWGKFHLQRYDTKQGMPAKFYIFPKDGSDVTNRFFIEVIDFLIDCIPNSDYKCIERIVNESIWSDIQDRSAGDTIRKEDEIGNIRDLKPVDMGVSVLWADRDLESDENVYFSFLDANKIIKNSGWRLPTFNEMSELTRHSAIYKNTFEECKFHGNANDLTFEKCGYQYADEDRILNTDSYYTWTSDTVKSGSEVYLTICIRKFITSVPMHYMNRCCVRLVKDK